jgi:exosortase/archaeosortase family protein
VTMTAPGNALEAPAQPGSPLVRTFVLRFVVLFTLFEALVYMVLWRAPVFQPYAELNARLTALLFGPLLEGVSVMQATLVTPGYSIVVRPGCDAYQACAVLLAGVIAFPAPPKRKLAGAAIGVSALLVLNLARLAALLWAGVHQPEHFDLLHLEILPALFVAASLCLLFGWILWARA